MGKTWGAFTAILAPWLFVACPAEPGGGSATLAGAGGAEPASLAGEGGTAGGAPPSGGGGQSGAAGLGQGGYDPDYPCGVCPCNLCGDGDLEGGNACAREGTLCGSCEDDCPMLLCDRGTWLSLGGEDRPCSKNAGGAGGAAGAGGAP